MLLQYDEDKANIKDALKSSKAGLYAYRFFICFSYYILGEVGLNSSRYACVSISDQC